MGFSEAAVVAATARLGSTGTAVLVDHRHLLTARHAIATKTRTISGKPLPPTLRFPSSADQSYTVVDLERGTVDFAVLDLDDEAISTPGGPKGRALHRPLPVPVWSGRRLPERVRVFGYPAAEAADEGVWRTFTVSGPTGTGTHQLDWTDTGTFRGHSGGPVIDSDTNALVGILVQGSTEGRFDRFIPIPVIADLWPGLVVPWHYAGAPGDDTRDHIRRRGTGQRGTTRGTNVFKGRTNALDAITSWVTTTEPDGRPLVITGQPGAGKSAVLARAVLDLEPRPDRRTELRTRGVVFHARQATALDFVNAVARLVTADTVASPAALVKSVDDQAGTLGDLPDPEPSGSELLVIMVDALDETTSSTDRGQMAEALTELARRPWVRVVVATRPRDPTQSTGPGTLLHALGVTSMADHSLINLDRPPYTDRDGLIGFASAVLRQDGVTYPGPRNGAWHHYRADKPLTRRLARRIAQAADRNFLVAALDAIRFSTDEQIHDPAMPEFDPALLATSVGEAIGKYLDQPGKGMAMTRGRLTALSYAQGVGINDAIWMRFAQSLGYPTTQVDLDLLRDSPAADYLIQQIAETGGRVSRLYHQALTDQLQLARDTTSDHAALSHALHPNGQLAETRTAGVCTWSHADTYTLSHLTDHAVAGECLPRLLLDIDFLLHCDLGRLLTVLLYTPTRDQQSTARLLLHFGARLVDKTAKDRTQGFALGAAQLTIPALRDAFCSSSHLLPQQLLPISARLLGSEAHLSRGQTMGVDAAAVDRLGDRDVIVFATDDRTVGVSDADGNLIRTPLTQTTARVNALAVGQRGGRDFIVAASWDRTVRTWDTDNSSIGDPLPGHTDRVTAVATGWLADREAIISGGNTAAALVWDLEGNMVGNPLITHTRGVRGLAVGRVGGIDVIVTASDDRAVRIWNKNGVSVGNPLIGHTKPVTAVAIGQLGGREVIVSASDDRTVRLWNADGTPIGDPLTGHTRPVTAVTVGRIGGRHVVVSASRDRTVRVWNADGTPIGEPLVGHTEALGAVAVGRLGDRDVIASAGDDCTVRVWEATADLNGKPLVGHTRGIHAVTVGRLGDRDVIVSGSWDCTLRVWDASGEPVGEPLTGHTKGVTGVAISRIDGRDVIVSASADGTLRLWDAAGAPVGVPLVGHLGEVAAVAVGRLGGRDSIVSAGSIASVLIRDANGTPVGQPLYGHTQRVTAVTIGSLNDQDIIVSASSDRTIRFWDANGESIGRPLAGHIQGVTAVTVGRLDNQDVIVSASSDCTLRLWSANGVSIGEPFVGHTDAVTAVAIGQLHHRTVLISASDDCSVRVWDAYDRSIIGTIALFDPARCVLIAPQDRIAMLTSNSTLIVTRLNPRILTDRDLPSTYVSNVVKS